MMSRGKGVKRMARISVFQCDTMPDLYGITNERTGRALLHARRDLRWTYLRDSEVAPEDGHSAADVVDMLHNLDRRGYYLLSTDLRSATHSFGETGAAGKTAFHDARGRIQRGSVAALESTADHWAQPVTGGSRSPRQGNQDTHRRVLS